MSKSRNEKNNGGRAAAHGTGRLVDGVQGDALLYLYLDVMG